MADGRNNKKFESKNNMKNKIIILISVLLVSFILLVLSIKGKPGNPFYYQSITSRDTFLGGPFENSGSTSRFALVEAIVENNKFTFTPQQAAFASPDISAYKGQAFSLFAPGVAFAGVPLYLLGKIFGIPQIMTFMVNIIFAVLNSFLIYKLARKLEADFYPSIAAGFLSIFATNIFTYSLSFTQHILTSTALLLGLLTAFRKNGLAKSAMLGAITGAAMLIDIVNVLFLMPILVFTFFKHFEMTKSDKKLYIKFNPAIFTFILGIIPFLAVLGYYNYSLSGSATTLAQFLGNAKIVNENGNIKVQQNKFADKNAEKASLPFESRRILNGLQVLLISEERSWLFYSPIMLTGVIGFILIYKRREDKEKIAVIASTAGISILAYSMFIDPWGGWAFGPRYLIPSAGLIAIGIGPFLEKFRTNKIIMPLFIAIAVYSIYINTIGAYTTSTVPPKIEAENLVVPTSWGINFNYDLISKNENSSLIYNLFALQHINSMQYIYLVSGVISLVFIGLTVPMYMEKRQLSNK